MCGIGFFINYDKKKKLDLDLVEEVFTKLSWRGKDACGWYYERIENGIMKRGVTKAPLTSKQLIEESKKFTGKNTKAKLNGTERLIILHTRAKTEGTEFDNENNHPMFGESWLTVHNGSIFSAPLSDYTYKGTCDSELILSYIEKKGIIEGLNASAGSIALIAKTITSNKLYLFRNTNPFFVMYDNKAKVLMGASQANHLPEYTPSTDDLFAETPMKAIEIPKQELFSISLTKPDMVQVSEMQVPCSNFTYDDKRGTINKPLDKGIWNRKLGKWEQGSFSGYTG